MVVLARVSWQVIQLSVLESTPVILSMSRTICEIFYSTQFPTKARFLNRSFSLDGVGSPGFESRLHTIGDVRIDVDFTRELTQSLVVV